MATDNVNNRVVSKPILPVNDTTITGTPPSVGRGDIEAPPTTGYHKPDPRYAKYQGSGKIGGVYGVRGSQAPLVLTSNGVTGPLATHAERYAENGVDALGVLTASYNEVMNS